MSFDAAKFGILPVETHRLGGVNLISSINFVSLMMQTPTSCGIQSNIFHCDDLKVYMASTLWWMAIGRDETKCEATEGGTRKKQHDK